MTQPETSSLYVDHDSFQKVPTHPCTHTHINMKSSKSVMFKSLWQGEPLTDKAEGTDTTRQVDPKIHIAQHIENTTITTTTSLHCTNVY